MTQWVLAWGEEFCRFEAIAAIIVPLLLYVGSRVIESVAIYCHHFHRHCHYKKDC